MNSGNLWSFNRILISNGFLIQSQKETEIIIEFIIKSLKMCEILDRFCCLALENQRSLTISNRNGLT